VDSLDSVDDLVDAGARQHIDAIPLDDSHHLAKVRVAGSNPVVRSKERRVQGYFRRSAEHHVKRRELNERARELIPEGWSEASVV
jgi:hypothetical protein